MKISYNWLKNYVKTEHSVERLCEILTDTGLEVEGIHKVESIKGGLEGVVIGEVVSCEKHENADKLKVTTVNAGREEPLQIVCGAPNVAVGQKVVVALVGSTLYPNPDEPFKIKKSKIRGVESNGMICAEDELGIGKSHNGIIVLPEDVKVGQPASTFFNLENDYQIEIGLTPNRSDALGHIGVARDVIAFNKVHKLERSTLRMPDISDYEVLESGDKISLKIESNDDCPKYMGCIISDVKVAESPEWIKRYLNTIGVVSINNIVDITNFVMHELGTPLHAFDFSKIGNEIEVKHAQKGEKFVTLDGEERILSDQDLMITNGKRNIALAGIMGGKDSAIDENTSSIFLEAAYFNPVTIRKSAKRHGLNTDASFRFERGVDVEMIEYAMKRAATLITEIAGGTISFEPIPFYPIKIEPTTVVFRYSKCNELIGKKLDKDIVNDILNSLGIDILHNNDDNLKLQIPSYRVDVTREADVIEEVLRIYGFNNIDLPTKLNISLSRQNLRNEEKRMNEIASLLVANGYFEMMNNSLTSSKFIDENGGEMLSNNHSIIMLNPLSEELNVLRQSLIFQGLSSIAHNRNRQNPNLKLFEFGKIYQKFDNEYVENKRLSIFVTGQKEKEQWNSNSSEVTFYTVKGIVFAVLNRLGLMNMVSTKALKKSVLEDGVQLYVQKNKIGEMGWTSGKTNKAFGVKQKVFIADLDWDMLLNLGDRNKIQAKSLPKTFAIRRDFSLLIDEVISYAEIEEIAYNTDRKLLKEMNLFDVYEGDKLPKNKKSYAVSFFFQDDEKTLKDEQVDKIMNKIREGLENKLKAELR